MERYSRVVITAGLGISIFFVWRELKKIARKKFRKVGHISEIMIFPLKGARGISCQSAILTNQGLFGSKNDTTPRIQDRAFIIICNKTGNYVSSKQNPKVTLISTEIISETSIKISSWEKEPVVVCPAEPRIEKNVTIYKMDANVYECNAEANAWITDFFDDHDENGSRISYSIYFFDPKLSKRHGESDMGRRLKKIGENLPENLDYDFNLADMAAIMVTSDKSLQDLNYKLSLVGKKKVTTENFRGNIEVECDDKRPYQEDDWDECYIGSDDWKMKYFYKCTRCLLTTITPDEGKHRKDKQPLQMLNSYRMRPEREHCIYDSAEFGTYFAGYKSNPEGKKIIVRYGITKTENLVFLVKYIIRYMV